MNRALRWIGGSLGIAGVVFVVLQLRDNADQIDLGRFGPYAWATLIFVAVVYGAANIPLARAWWLILKSLNVPARWAWAIKAYGVSQLAKYLPGNLFHLASRQALGQAAGFPAGPVAKSAVYELALVATAGVLIAGLALPLLLPDTAPVFGLMIYGVIFIAAIYGIRKWLGRTIATSLCWQSLFFAASGTVFIVTVSLINAEAVRPEIMPVLCGAYVVSWLIGFLTPGAPAGIGVREVVLTVLLGRIVPEADLLLAVVLARLVTMLGDFGFFAATGALKVKTPLERPD